MTAKKILLVEDVYYNQVLIESLIISWGFEVDIVKDGVQALKALELEKPDLIILDLMMPVMDGFKFLEEKKRTGDTTTVLVVSARKDLESIQRALLLGANDYITKPFNTFDLENKVRILLAET
jgi:two-component system response regulator MprA